MKKKNKSLYITICFFVLVFFTNSFFSNVAFAQNNSTKNESTRNADEIAPPKITNRVRDPKPYNQNNFPDWAYYGFRFLAVGVGSIPFSLLFATIAYDGYKTYDESTQAGSLQNKYLPLFFSGPDKPAYIDEEVQELLKATLAISLSVSITDLIVLVIRRQRGETLSSVFR